jgi:acetylornithine/N-succinyldiaminopimelate aminotransferase
MKNPIIPFYQPSDKYIVRAKDCCVYDEDGKEYIDFESGVWSANLGHGNQRINKIIEQQLQVCMHNGYMLRSHSSEALAEKLQEKLGLSGGQSVFLCSGSEAVNLAITISQFLTKRSKILKIDNSFLSSYGFGRLSSDNTSKVDIPFNDASAISQIDFSEISAFVVETGGASVDMVQFPDKDFIAAIIHQAKKHNCIVIANEVTTGFGRMGTWFGFHHYDFTPDIVATGKGLGNGYPVSGVSVSKDIAEMLNHPVFRYAQSHQNDPLGCTVGLEVIKVMEEENIIEKSKETGEYFRKQLLQLKDKHPDKIKDIRARGLMLAIEFSDNINGDLLHHELFDGGFITGYKNNTLRFLPPLTISKTHIDKLIQKTDGLTA